MKKDFSTNKSIGKKLFPSTDLCVDIKTLLRHDPLARFGKNYLGLLRHDNDYHYTFREIAPITSQKRNHRVYYGETITITQRDNGSLRLNFRPVSMGPDFNPATFASNVANELLWSLSSLLEK
jgi:hypothetical protein